MRWNKWLILTVALVLVAIPFAYSDSYWDYLTRGLADTLYCPIGGGCGGGSNATNITGSGSANNLAVWYNTTHLTYNTTVIGGGSLGPNITAEYFTTANNTNFGIHFNITNNVLIIGNLSGIYG